MIASRTSALLLLAVGTLVSGEALACGADEGKLQALRRGMTYEETAQVMGCPGRAITHAIPSSGAFSSVEWIGSDMPGISYTQVDFQDGRLLSFTTNRPVGL